MIVGLIVAALVFAFMTGNGKAILEIGFYAFSWIAIVTAFLFGAAWLWMSLVHDLWTSGMAGL